MDIVQLKQMEPIFGSWYIEKEIGSGSFGKVYSIYKDDAGFRFRAALKVITIPSNPNDIQELDSQGFDHAAKVRYFDNISSGIMEEIRIMNTLRGFTNVVCFEDYQVIPHEDRIGRDILIRMELLERLDDYMHRIRATQYDVVVMLRDIAQALVLCDKKNIIHRDIKPDNIMVSENGDYKLVDFGIAKNMERTSQASTKAGSYPYMAPEVQMHQPYGKVVDIYSLGVVGYRELNAYRYPFLPPYPQPFTAEERDMALYRRFRGDKIPPIPGVSRQLFSIIEKCMAHKPEHRYSNPQQLVNDLNSVIKLPELRKKRLFDDAGNMLPVYNEKEFNPASFREGSQKGGSGSESSMKGPMQDSSVQGSMQGAGSGGSFGGSSRSMAAPEKKKGKKTGIIIAVVLALIAAGAGAFFFLSQQEDKTHVPIQASILRESELPEHADSGTVGAKSSEILRIEGTASPRAELILNYSSVTEKTKADGDGHYSFEVNASSLTADGTTEFSVSYANPNETDTPATASITRDGSCTLSIDEEASTADLITGTTDPWGLVYGINGDGTPVEADGSGHFSGKNTTAKSGSVLSVWAEDVYGNRSETREYNVPYTPVSLSIDCTGKNGKQVITGKTTSIQLSGEGPDREILNIRVISETGVPLYAGNVEVNNGEWIVQDVDLSSLNGTGTLTLTAEWSGSFTHPGQTASISVDYDRNCYLLFSAPIGNILTEDTDMLQGVTDRDASVRLFSADGKLLAIGKADENGNFVMEGLNLTAGDIPYGIATDTAENESEPYTLMQVQPGTKQEAAAADDGRIPVTLRIEGAEENEYWKSGTVPLTGEAAPGKELEARIGSQTAARFQATGDGERGTYSTEISLQDFGSTRGQELAIQVLYADGGGQASDIICLKYDTGVSDPVAPDFVTDTATEIHGQADPGDQVILGESNGEFIAKALGEATAEADGTFVVRLEETLKVDGIYLLYAQDDAGNTSAFIPVKVILTTRETPAVSVMQNERYLRTGSRMNGNPMTIELQSGETEYGILITMTGSESGTEVSFPIENQIVLTDTDFAGFRDGESIRLTAHYADWDKTRNSYSMDLTMDNTAAMPELKTASLTAEMTTVEGTAEPGSKIYLIIGGNRYEGITDEEGSFRFEGLYFTAGQSVDVYAVDSLGNTSETAHFEVLAIAGVVIDPMPESLSRGYINGKESQLSLTGTAEPGKTIEIRLDGSAAATGRQVSEAGTWDAMIDLSALEADTIHSLTLLYTGNERTANSIQFTYDPACGDITVTDETITEDSETIQGTTESGATVVMTAEDGEKGRTETGIDGSFEIELPMECRQQGMTITLQATDRAGNESGPYSITVEKSQRTAIAIEREKLTEENGVYLVAGGVQTLELNGRGYGQLPLTVTMINETNGAETRTESRCDHGTWTVKAALPQNWSTARVAVSYGDGKYPELGDSLQLKYDGACTLTCDQDTLLETMSELVFRTEAGATLQATLNEIQGLEPEQAGETIYRIALPALREGDIVRVTAMDRAGNTAVIERRVQLEERPAPTIQHEPAGEWVNAAVSEMTFRGTAMPDRPVTLRIGEKAFENLPVDENGEWTRQVTMDELQLADGEVNCSIGYSDREAENYDRFIYDTSVSIETEEDGFTVNEDTGEIRGRTESNAKLWLTVNGEEKAQQDTEDGQFSFTGFGPLDAGDEIRITVEDAAGNRNELQFTVAPAVRREIRITEPEILDGHVRTGQLRISGQAGAGHEVRITVTDDGAAAAEQTAAANGNGEWTVADTGIFLADGESFTVTAAYADGKSVGSSASIQFTADGSCFISGIPETVTDMDRTLSGQTDKDANIFLTVNGSDTLTAKADGNGNFRFDNLAFNCDDTVTIQAEDPLGNPSETVSRIVDTGKEKIWADIKQPTADSKVTALMYTAGFVFSHEPISVYYIISDGTNQETVTLTEEDLGEITDTDIVADARKKNADPDLFSIRHEYELSSRKNTGELTIPDGDYTYTLYAQTANSNSTYELCTMPIHLERKKAEETAPQYSSEYSYTDPLFAAGLDTPVMTEFPKNEILLTGWIWAAEDTIKLPDVYYRIVDNKLKPIGWPVEANEVRQAGGSAKVVYRNIAAERPGLSGKFGTPKLDQAGFILRIPVTDDMNLKPGTFLIEVLLSDQKRGLGVQNEWTIGICEITIRSDGSWDAAAREEQIIGNWDDRPEDEKKKKK